MNFQELYDNVVQLTDRPELVKETEIAIQRATLRMHHIDFFVRDINHVGISSSGGRVANIAMSSFPGCRKVTAVRAFVKSGRSWNIKIGTEKELFTSGPAHHNKYAQDVAYLLGAVLQVKSSQDFDSLGISYVKNPDVTKAGYSSWIAELYPFAIIDDSAASVLYTIGANEQAANLRALVGSKERMGRDTHIHTILSEQLVHDGADEE